MRKFPLVAGGDAYIARKRNANAKDYAARYAIWCMCDDRSKVMQPQAFGLTDLAASKIRADIDELVTGGRSTLQARPVYIGVILEVAMAAIDAADARERFKVLMRQLMVDGAISDFSIDGDGEEQ